MAHAVLGLGGNLGARSALLSAAVTLLDAEPGCKVLARSPLYETPPLGPPQPDYLNAAVRVELEIAPEALLAACQRIERLLGRERQLRWGPRTVDIDFLYWSGGSIAGPQLSVPHPELMTRAFALAPLLDVAPELHDRFGSALVRAGGAPRLAELGWPVIAREPDGDVGCFTRDEAELASQLGALWAGERVGSGALCAREVRGPATLFDACGHSWLEDAIRSASSLGFAVCCAAVTDRTESECRCVLLGAEGSSAPESHVLEVRVEQRDDQQRRLRARRG